VSKYKTLDSQKMTKLRIIASALASLAQIQAQQTASLPQNCSCENFQTDTDAGAIWPAYGHVVFNQAPETGYVIVPPADCEGSNCWRANITCAFNSKFLNDYDRNRVSVSWEWYWKPSVQYPLGDKNYYDDFGDGPKKLPTNSEINFAESKLLDTVCPTNYTKNTKTGEEGMVKFCPINIEFQDEENPKEWIFQSTMIIYDYLNEQDDGTYSCVPIISGSNQKQNGRNRRPNSNNNLPSLSKVECCGVDVYYASPKWNGWCWWGMIYSIVGGSVMLWFLSRWVTESHLKSL